MLAKSFIPIVFILFIQANVSKCFLPIFVDFDHQANLFDRFQSRFDILPRIAESFFVQSFFMTDEQPEPIEENINLPDENDYFDSMTELENKLNMEQENFIHKFILHDVEQFEQEVKAMTTTRQTLSQEPAFIFIELDKAIEKERAQDLIAYISKFTSLPLESFKNLKINSNLLTFKVDNTSTSFLVNQILKYQVKILKEKELEILSCGLVNNQDKAKLESEKKSEQTKEIMIIFGIVSMIALFSMLIVFALVYLLKKKFFSPDGLEKKGLEDEEYLVNESSKKDDSKWLAYVPFMKPKKTTEDYSKNYQDLCRQRMHSKVSPINPGVCTSLADAQTPTPTSNCQVVNSSNTINSTPIRITDAKVDQSRNSSWLEESICHPNIDFNTGHVILSYMEKYLNDKNLMDKDWKYLTEYEADENSTRKAAQRKNYQKNRYDDRLPYDFSLVKLKNADENDYINASYIIDDDPKKPVYIAAQSPLKESASEFWQMIWDNQTVVIVNLCNDSQKCFQYWPDSAFKIYNKFEIHFTSEHAWNNDFIVRNFFFKNIDTDQTRTVTQFQFLTWEERTLPTLKSFLEFRKNVNKSFSGKACPIVVSCDDGMGRTGTYILIDMVLNKIARDAKEIDLAATVEFLRDQRPQMVRYKEQYEFSFQVVIHQIKQYLNYLGN